MTPPALALLLCVVSSGAVPRQPKPFPYGIRDDSSKTAFVSDGGRLITAVDLSNGRVRWTHQPAMGSLWVEGADVVVHGLESDGLRLTALNARTGKMRRSSVFRPLPAEVREKSIETLKRSYSAQMCVVDGVLQYRGTFGSEVTELSFRLDLRRLTELPGPVASCIPPAEAAMRRNAEFRFSDKVLVDERGLVVVRASVAGDGVQLSLQRWTPGGDRAEPPVPFLGRLEGLISSISRRHIIASSKTEVEDTGVFELLAQQKAGPLFLVPDFVMAFEVVGSRAFAVADRADSRGPVLEAFDVPTAAKLWSSPARAGTRGE